MQLSPTLGEKIKYFRNRAGLSQLELETAIDASPGSISRIESGKVNPTKETLLQVARALQLNQAEIVYLTTNPYFNWSGNVEEIKQSFRRLADSSNIFGYLLDPFSRVLLLSQGFKNLAQIEQVDGSRLENMHILELLLNPALGVRSRIASEEWEQIAINELAVWSQEKRYLQNEPVVKEVLKSLQTLPNFKQLWEQSKSFDYNAVDHESRHVSFFIQGQKMPMLYHFTNYPEDPRFTFIEYSQKIEH